VQVFLIRFDGPRGDDVNDLPSSDFVLTVLLRASPKSFQANASWGVSSVDFWSGTIAPASFPSFMSTMAMFL
jgi:hypothetical protein